MGPPCPEDGGPNEVKLEAFPFTRYGLVTGRLRKFGRDAANSGPNGATPGSGAAAMASGAAADLAYPAKVSLDREWIAVDGQRETIRPGMRPLAEIRTGDRKVIEYLLLRMFRPSVKLR